MTDRNKMALAGFIVVLLVVTGYMLGVLGQARVTRDVEIKLDKALLDILDERAAAVKAGVAEYYVELDGSAPGVKFRYVSHKKVPEPGE